MTRLRCDGAPGHFIIKLITVVWCALRALVGCGPKSYVVLIVLLFLIRLRMFGASYVHGTVYLDCLVFPSSNMLSSQKLSCHPSVDLLMSTGVAIQGIVSLVTRNVHSFVKFLFLIRRTQLLGICKSKKQHLVAWEKHMRSFCM